MKYGTLHKINGLLTQQIIVKDMTPKEFVKQYFFEAFQSQIRTGVPVLVTLAQAALESGWGKYAKGNNFFGIKAGKSWQGETQVLKTKEEIEGKVIQIEAKFRKYETAEESFVDHGLLLKDRFPKSFVHSDPVDFVNSMQKDHGYKYATDSKYVDKIAELIRMIKKIVLEM